MPHRSQVQRQGYSANLSVNGFLYFLYSNIENSSVDSEDCGTLIQKRDMAVVFLLLCFYASSAVNKMLLTTTVCEFSVAAISKPTIKPNIFLHGRIHLHLG